MSLKISTQCELLVCKNAHEKVCGTLSTKEKYNIFSEESRNCLSEVWVYEHTHAQKNKFQFYKINFNSISWAST